MKAPHQTPKIDEGNTNSIPKTVYNVPTNNSLYHQKSNDCDTINEINKL